jgi:hypothetical protein
MFLKFPTDHGLNATMVVNTTGIQTKVNCANPVNTALIPNSNNNTFTIESTSVDNCVHQVTFDPRVSYFKFPRPSNTDAVIPDCHWAVWSRCGAMPWTRSNGQYISAACYVLVRIFPNLIPCICSM